MDLSTPTEELTLGGTPEAASVASTELHSLTSSAIRQRCAACGAAMAADQRYCVECGERRGAPRVSLLEGPARRAQESPAQSAPAPRRRTAPVNSTLISVIGILLLAMGIGVLIGRSGNNTAVKSPPAQVVTVTGAPSSGTAAATPTTPSTSATPASGSASAAAKAKSKAATTPASTKSKAPAPKAVKVGTPGHGRGYQNGHFTGNFFGE